MKNSVALAFILSAMLVKGSVAQKLPSSVLDASGVSQAYASSDKVSKRPVLRPSESQLSFEQNVGQTDNRVKFLGRAHGYSLFLTDREAVFAFQNRKSQVGDSKGRVENNSFRLRFVGSNRKPEISGIEMQTGRSNYLTGVGPSQWHTNIQNYGKVRYKDLYPGIDLLYYGNDRKLEYDLQVSPGANPGQITLALAGAKHLQIDSKGNLTLRCGLHQFSMEKPRIYQISSQKERELVSGSWVLKDDHTLGFNVDQYDRTKTLVIDPQFSFPFATYLGGSGDDYGTGIAVDSNGSAYVTGQTSSPNFPTTTGTLQPNAPSTGLNAFVAKYNPDGSRAYVTYLGGGSDVQNVEGVPTSQGKAIAVNNAGNAFVTGYSNAHGSFPTKPTQTGCGSPVTATNCSNVFLTELTSDGSAQVYGVFIYGDMGRGIALDSNNNAYLAGSTFGGAPISGSLQASFGGGTTLGDAFVAKVDPTGLLSWWTYLGGSGEDQAEGIALDAIGNIYVTGQTSNVNVTIGPSTFPIKNAIQSTYGGNVDAFVAEINNAGTQLIYSTFLGGSAKDQGQAIAVDTKGNAYVTGFTLSSNFPTLNPLQGKYGGGQASGDAFVTAISPAGAAIVYSTYLGGNGDDSGNGIAVDSNGNAYVAGAIGSAATQDPLNPFGLKTIGSIDSNVLNLGPNSIQPQCGDTDATCADAFITAINSTGNQFLYFTYLGGNGIDYANAVALNSSANCSQTVPLPSEAIPPCAYVTGSTASEDFPISDDTSLQGSSDAFGAWAPSLTLPVCTRTLTQVGLTLTAGVSCTANFVAGQGNINWGDGTTFSTVSLNAPGSVSATHNYSAAYSPSTGPISVVPSASMTNTAGTGTTYGTPFPVIQLAPIAVGVSSPATTVQAPATLQFSAVVQYASDTSVTWDVNGVPGGNSTLGQISTGGLYTPPANLTGPISVGITAIANADHQTSSTAFMVQVIPPISVTIATTPPTASPATLQIPATLQFTAAVNNASNTAVTWYVNGVAGGNSTIGVISPAGLYTPPSSLTTPISIRITAVANADNTTTSAPFTVNVNPPIFVTLTPTNPSVVAGTAALVVTAALPSYASSPNVNWVLTGTGCGGHPCGSINTQGPGTSVSYTPPGSLPGSSSITDTLTATSVADPTKTSQTIITVTAVPVGVTISPTSATVTAGQSKPIQFTPVVSGATNTAVTWKLSGTGCTNAPCGTLSASGLYTPPASAISQAPQIDTVTATSQADTTKSASAQVTITNPVSVSISPSGNFSIEVGTSADLVAIVTGSQNTAVIWSVTGSGCTGKPCGTISQAGHYVAPTTLAASVTDTIVATPQADLTKSASTQAVIFLPATAPAPASATVTAGQPAQYSVAIAPGTGDPVDPLILGCSNLPNGSICQFFDQNQNPLSGGNLLPVGATKFAVTITTTGQTSSLLKERPRDHTPRLAFTPLLGLLLLSLSARIHRRLFRATRLVLLLMAVGLFITACGTNGSFGTNQLPNPTSTPAGSYSVKVTGTPKVAPGQIQPSIFTVTTLPLTVH
jgi:hypothetical protein